MPACPHCNRPVDLPTSDTPFTWTLSCLCGKALSGSGREGHVTVLGESEAVFLFPRKLPLVERDVIRAKIAALAAWSPESLSPALWLPGGFQVDKSGNLLTEPCETAGTPIIVKAES